MSLCSKRALDPDGTRAQTNEMDSLWPALYRLHVSLVCFAHGPENGSTGWSSKATAMSTEPPLSKRVFVREQLEKKAAPNQDNCSFGSSMSVALRAE
eukprot:4783708-Amphidinium_carterae.1